MLGNLLPRIQPELLKLSCFIFSSFTHIFNLVCTAHLANMHKLQVARKRERERERESWGGRERQKKDERDREDLLI